MGGGITTFRSSPFLVAFRCLKWPAVRPRWRAADLNLRYLKTTVNMECLAAKRPEMVYTEVWAHLLAYSLLRSVMEQAAP